MSQGRTHECVPHRKAPGPAVSRGSLIYFNYRLVPLAEPESLEIGALDAPLWVVEAGLLAAIVPDVPAGVAAFVE